MYQNPILYADYSDPDVIRVGQDYYMVASSFTYLPGVPILHSRDLVHWEIINYCVPSLPFDRYDLPRHGSGTWAPSIRYHGGMFYVFIPLPDEGIFVARCEDIRGQFRLNCIQEAKGWIDPCPLWDDDGKAYMVFAYARSRCGIKHRLAMVEMNPDCTRLLGEPVVVFHKEDIAPTIEGPKLYKKDGLYYIFAPAGGVATGWQMVLRSDSIWGPYEYRTVLAQGSTEVNGPHQGGWVTAPDGKDWFVHFQDVMELGRITHLQPMQWQDGWPVMGKEGAPVARWELPAKDAPRYSIAQSDDFQGETLGLQWQWQANPRQAFYAMESPGLRLNCLPVSGRESLLWYAPNALTQIPQHKALRAEVQVTLRPEKQGDLAALGMLGHRYGYLALEHGQESNFLSLYSGVVTDKEDLGKAEETLACQIPWASDSVHLRLELTEEKTYRFFHSPDGVAFTPIGEPLPLDRCTWTGAKLCLWSSSRREASNGCGIYRHFQITAL